MSAEATNTATFKMYPTLGKASAWIRFALAEDVPEFVAWCQTLPEVAVADPPHHSKPRTYKLTLNALPDYPEVHAAALRIIKAAERQLDCTFTIDDQGIHTPMPMPMLKMKSKGFGFVEAPDPSARRPHSLDEAKPREERGNGGDGTPKLRSWVGKDGVRFTRTRSGGVSFRSRPQGMRSEQFPSVTRKPRIEPDAEGDTTQA